MNALDNDQTSNSQFGDDHKYPLTKTKTWKEYFIRRFHHSNLYTCWYHNEMDVNDSDSIVNSVTVVNALLLTIPFNLLGAYNEGNVMTFYHHHYYYHYYYHHHHHHHHHRILGMGNE